jgi:polysaccharide pyruvyl transferase WcaK-like protein
VADSQECPRQIAFLSPCGWGNLGDAAIVDALIHGVRLRIPGAHIVGFTLNPADTAWRHAVQAFTCAAFSLPSYPVLEPSGGQAAAEMGGSPEIPTPAHPRGLMGALRALLRGLPIPGALRPWLVAPIRLLREPAHLRMSRERLRGTTLLVVAGGGQLDAVWGGPLGHPYALWRWARLARRVGARFAVASVGTGTLGPVSRRLVLGALRLASYRSYRDAISRTLLRAPGLTADDPIVPDLAYGLPVRPVPPPNGPRLVIGISPMNYRHPDHWPQRDVDAYRQHVTSLGALAARLLAAGHEVVIFTTDRDRSATADSVAAAGDLRPEERSRLRIAETDTVPALFETLAGLDVVVAARLHGVLLAHLAHRPVLAIAHERKVRTLMRDSGQERYCVEIDAADPEILDGQLQTLIAERAALGEQIAAYVASCRSRVAAQFDALFGPEPADR